MQYLDEDADLKECHSTSLSNTLAELMNSADAKRLLRRAAIPAASCGGAIGEDLIADVVCDMLAGDIQRDERSLLDQLVAEVGRRARRERRRQKSSHLVALDDVPSLELVDPGDMQDEATARDAGQILETARAMAIHEPLVRQLIGLHLRGGVKRRDAIAAGLTPYQYRVASSRLEALCRAAAAVPRAPEMHEDLHKGPTEIPVSLACAAAR